MNQDTNSILFFKNDFIKFSNFYATEVIYDNMTYGSVEHGFQAAKTLSNLHRIKIQKVPPDKAGLAKRIGKSVPLRPGWDLMKISIMRKLLEKKFCKSEFRDLLLSTEDKYLEEGNYWHDNFWGNCHCKKCKNIKGLNNLGKLLMKIRVKLNENKL